MSWRRQNLCRWFLDQNRRSGSGKLVSVVGTVAALAAVVAAIVISVLTKDGTLVVDIDQPDAYVQVVNEQGTKVEIDCKGEKGHITISVDPGKHQLKVTKDGFEIFAENFEIQSRGEKTITAKLIPSEDEPSEGLDRRAAEWVLTGGGRVRVSVLKSAQTILVQSGESLPETGFELTSVEFMHGVTNDDSLAP